MINIQVLSDKILVETEDESTSQSPSLHIHRIYEPGDARTGKVVAVGHGRQDENGVLIDMKVQLGDTIWFQYGQKITVEGKSYVLVTESGDVIGIHMAPERN